MLMLEVRCNQGHNCTFLLGCIKQINIGNLCFMLFFSLKAFSEAPTADPAQKNLHTRFISTWIVNF